MKLLAFLALLLASTAHAGVQLNVFNPPTDPAQPGYSDVQQYLLAKSSPAYPLISGAVISIDWSDFDLGDTARGTHSRYDFSLVDAAIAPWLAAGKTVNLVLQTTPYGGFHCRPHGIGSRGADSVGNCSLPPWMWTALTPANFTTCAAARIPNYLAPAFIANYQSAISALVTHYASDPRIGYLRIGLGKGGEINLPQGWDDPSIPCGAAFTTRWHYTVGDSARFSWNAYLASMLLYEGGPNFAGSTSPKQLMTSITPVQAPGVSPDEVADFIAPIAAALHIGFGNQGLSAMAMQNCKGMQADWCALFARFTGVVPLELQTLGRSCPGGSCSDSQSPAQQHWSPNNNQPSQTPGRWQGSQSNTTARLSTLTGSLVPLLPFAIKNHATILEIYCDDWLTAFSPNGPGHAAYGAAYARTLQQAAATR